MLSILCKGKFRSTSSSEVEREFAARPNVDWVWTLNPQHPAWVEFSVISLIYFSSLLKNQESIPEFQQIGKHKQSS